MPNGGVIAMEQSNIKKKLTGLFATHGMAEIEANDSALLKDTLGIEKYSQLLQAPDDDPYKKYYLTLKNLGEKLDKVGEEAENLEQVKGCLNLLWETKKSNAPHEHLDILSDLIKERKILYRNWNPGEKKYYNDGLDMITKWKHYFLSYTTRNLIETNNVFKSILVKTFGDKYFDDSKDRVNCVAGLIVHYLKENNLTAFFDRDNLKCGDMIEKEVFNHCQSVYAFVQLVEPWIFQPREEKKNWCADEYETFTRWSSQNRLNSYKRFYFIKTEKNVYPANFPPYYEDWQKAIEGLSHIPDLSSLNRDDIRNEIGKIAKEIVNTSKKVLEDYIC